MVAIEVAIGDRGETIHIEVADDTVRIARRGAWELRLTREEAWRLAEAIERLAIAR